MLLAADDDHLEADFFGDGLEAGRRHLARRADGKPIAGNDERLAGVHALAEVGHQIAERAGLPAFVERVEALRHAIGGGRDLIGVDRVELLSGVRGSQKISARPRTSRPLASVVSSDGRGPGKVSTVMPGFNVAGCAICMLAIIARRDAQKPAVSVASCQLPIQKS